MIGRPFGAESVSSTFRSAKNGGRNKLRKTLRDCTLPHLRFIPRFPCSQVIMGGSDSYPRICATSASRRAMKLRTTCLLIFGLLLASSWLGQGVRRTTEFATRARYTSCEHLSRSDERGGDPAQRQEPIDRVRRRHIVAAAKSLGIGPLEWVLDTDHHRDQCAGAARLKQAGAKIAVPAAEAEFFGMPPESGTARTPFSMTGWISAPTCSSSATR